jgi:hypothetical protein
MRLQIATLAAASVVALFISQPPHLHGQQATDPAQHEQHHPGTPAPSVPSAPQQQPEMALMMTAMKANNQKLDELVKKMNAAEGPAKVGAIAEVLTALVQERRTTCESMMANKNGDAHTHEEAK